MKKIFLALIALLMVAASSFATTRTASVTGNWNSTTTWGGTVPNANDDVVINAGVTVTINVNPNNINNVTVNGVLQFDATGTGRTWTVNSAFTVNLGGSFSCMAPGSSTTHTLNYNGTTLTNNGTFNLVNGSNKCNVVIGGSATQNVNGTSSLTFNKLTLNNTGGKFQIEYGGGSFTPSEVNPTKLNTNITTNDSLVIKQGLLVGCATSNATITHNAANFKMGSGTSKVTSSVNIFTSIVTITVNTAMILNDATNSNVTFNVNGSFTTPSMSQANAATAYGVLGPNCQGGASNATALNITGDWNMTDIFVFVGNTKLLGGTEPNNPVITASGNISWASSETHTIDLPFTSDDFYLKTCYFGLFDASGAFPSMILNGGTVATPKTFSIDFDVFDGEVQYSEPAGTPTYAQISESMSNWTVNGNWKILNGASLAIHSDNTLTINGSLRVESGSEIAGSETETDDTGYVPVIGPSIAFGAAGVLYVENTGGLGKGVLTDAASNVALKNRTADLDWNLNNISSAGTIAYETNSQTVTDRTYNHLTLTTGTKTLGGTITVNGNTTINAATTLADATFTNTLKGTVTNNGIHSGTAKTIFGGTTNQSLSGTCADWGNMEINNAAGATCASNISTSGSFTFTSGILTTSNTAMLIFTNSGAIGGSALTCIYGPVQKTSASTSLFTLPLGKGGNFRPLVITPSSSSSTVWTAEYFNTAFSNTTSVVAPITSVNTHSYWTCTRSGAANAILTLQWNTTEALTDLNGLTVASWSGTNWTDAGASTTTGTATSGTVASNTITSFSTFTLGEANTIATGTITGSPFCPEAVVNVPFTSTGTFNAGNIYTAELSDKKGVFGAPTVIGTLSSTANSGTIVASIASKPKAGTKFRIRVVSSTPSVIGTDNGVNMEVIACDKVTNLTATGITSSTANINYTTVPCAAKYKVQYRKLGVTTWTTKYSTTGTYMVTGLTANTTYEYRVQTYCTESGSSKAGFTSIQSFTTTLRMGDEAIATTDEMRVYPNPAADLLHVTFNANESSKAVIKIYNAIGEVLMNKTVATTIGNNNFTLDIRSLASGMYFVAIESGNEPHQLHKLVKE